MRSFGYVVVGSTLAILHLDSFAITRIAFTEHVLLWNSPAGLGQVRYSQLEIGEGMDFTP